MIVDQLDDHIPGRRNRAEGQGGRQGRDRVQGFGPERAVTRQAEGAEPLGPLEAGDVQRAPPEQVPHDPRKATDPQRLAIDADVFERLVLVPGEGFLKLGDRLLLRGAEGADEDARLAAIRAFEGQRAVHPGVLIQPRPGELQERPAQRRVVRADQGVGPHEEDLPRGTRRMLGARAEQRRDVHRARDRRRGDLTGEMNQVDHELAGASDRQTTSLRLVHPCTSARRNHRSRPRTFGPFVGSPGHGRPGAYKK